MASLDVARTRKIGHGSAVRFNYFASPKQPARKRPIFCRDRLQKCSLYVLRSRPA
jgi:hypothetical protein